MLVKSDNVETIGELARLVRKSQSLDQLALSAVADSGITFVSQFENGKETVQLGKVLQLLEALGIEVYLDLPLERSTLSQTVLRQIDSLNKGLVK